MNITINSTGWIDTVNNMPKDKVLNSEFLLKFCKELSGSIDNALMIMAIGFVLKSVVYFFVNRIIKDPKYGIDIALLIRNVGDIIVFIGLVFLIFMRLSG